MVRWLLISFFDSIVGAIVLHPWLSPHAPLWLPILLATLAWSIMVNIVLAVPRLRRWLHEFLR